MKAIIALLALIGVASAGFLVRTPSFDSAVVKSDRLGGNFAYSAVTGHSYAAVAPIVQSVATPVAVSYSAHAPVVTSYGGLYRSHLGYPYAYSYGAYSPYHGSVVVA